VRGLDSPRKLLPALANSRAQVGILPDIEDEGEPVRNSYYCGLREPAYSFFQPGFVNNPNLVGLGHTWKKYAGTRWIFGDFRNWNSDAMWGLIIDVGTHGNYYHRF
jgi:hypothetical protein